MTAADDASERAAAVEDENGQYRKLTPGPGRTAAEVRAHQHARIRGAMIEVVVERGYDAVRVRDLVRLAGVSSRTFYENFASKEDCFLRTYEMVMDRASRRIVAAQANEPDWRKRTLLAFTALAQELESQPDAARFALVEAYAAGPVALEQVRLAERTLESVLKQSLAREPGGTVAPSLVVEGIAGGVAGVARARVLADRAEEFSELTAGLAEWALTYPGKAADTLADLDRKPVRDDTRLEIPAPISPGGNSASPPLGERGDLLESVVRLAVAIGYEKLTITRIRIAAKVSRKAFDANFDGVEDCFLAALELKADEALARAALAQSAGGTWSGSVYRGISAICDQLAADPFLALACLANPFAEGSAGDRTRRRLLTMIVDHFGDLTPLQMRPAILDSEASNGALWALFHRHLVRNWAERNQIAATLAFIALAPVIGGPDAVAAIRSEQAA